MSRREPSIQNESKLPIVPEITPAYIYDLDVVTEAVDDLFGSLPPSTDIYYSLKANPNPAIVSQVKNLGCFAEVCSSGELAIALRSGFIPTEILFTGPGKTFQEVSNALGHGVRKFSVESINELELLNELASSSGIRAKVLLRVNPLREGSNGGLHMTGGPSQFGFDEEDLSDSISTARRLSALELVGLHIFSMTNARNEEALISEFTSNINAATRVARENDIDLDLLGIGGGFASPFSAPGRRPDYPNLGAAVSTILDEHIPGWRSGQPRIFFESGRYIVGSSGRLVCEVVDVKVSRGKTYVVLNGGINIIGGMSGLGRLMPLSLRLSGSVSDASTIADFVGPLCTPVDVLGRNVPIDKLAVGDRITIENVGAYGASASLLGFLSRPGPIEIVLHSGRVVSESRTSVERIDVKPTSTE